MRIDTFFGDKYMKNIGKNKHLNWVNCLRIGILVGIMIIF